MECCSPQVAVTAICTLMLALTVVDQVFAFLGYLWLPILVNFCHIIFTIVCLFGVHQRRIKITSTYLGWSVLWLGWCIFIICLFLHAGSLVEADESRILSLNTDGHSWWRTSTRAGCSTASSAAAAAAAGVANVTKSSSAAAAASDAGVTTAATAVSSAAAAATVSSGAEDSGGCPLAYGYVHVIFAAFHIALVVASQVATSMFVVLFGRKKDKLLNHSSADGDSRSPQQQQYSGHRRPGGAIGGGISAGLDMSSVGSGGSERSGGGQSSSGSRGTATTGFGDQTDSRAPPRDASGRGSQRSVASRRSASRTAARSAAASAASDYGADDSPRPFDHREARSSGRTGRAPALTINGGFGGDLRTAGASPAYDSPMRLGAVAASTSAAALLPYSGFASGGVGLRGDLSSSLASSPRGSTATDVTASVDAVAAGRSVHVRHARMHEHAILRQSSSSGSGADEDGGGGGASRSPRVHNEAAAAASARARTQRQGRSSNDATVVETGSNNVVYAIPSARKSLSHELDVQAAASQTSPPRSALTPATARPASAGRRPAFDPASSGIEHAAGASAAPPPWRQLPKNGYDGDASASPSRQWNKSLPSPAQPMPPWASRQQQQQQQQQQLATRPLPPTTADLAHRPVASPRFSGASPPPAIERESAVPQPTQRSMQDYPADSRSAPGVGGAASAGSRSQPSPDGVIYMSRSALLI